jgi:hypothetical protein
MIAVDNVSQPGAKEVWRLGKISPMDGCINLSPRQWSTHLLWDGSLCSIQAGLWCMLRSMDRAANPSAVYTFGADGVTGTLTAPDGVQPLSLALPLGRCHCPKLSLCAISVGQRLDLTNTAN